MGLPPFTYFAKYSHGYRHLTHPLESCSERGHAAPLPKHGYALFGQHGMDLGFEARALMNEVHLGDAYRLRLESLRDLIEVCEREITMLRSWHNALSLLRGAVRGSCSGSMPSVCGVRRCTC